MKDKIDFVIAWVDCNDKCWNEEKEIYSKNYLKGNEEVRFRNWDNLQYWFRGVEKFTPWVRKIHFITYGHLPHWLNINHPKLNIVKHEDYIPRQYLPTFSSHTIELNMHKIKGLSENFVYFNDDMFIINYMKKSDFFKKGVPCDSAVLNVPNFIRNGIGHVVGNDVEIINSYFNKNDVIKKNMFKWLNVLYKHYLIRTLLLLPWENFTGFLDIHLPSSYNKKTLQEVWEKEYDILDKTCKSKFRSDRDVNQWIFRYWQLASGSFAPRNINIGKYFELSFDNSKIFNSIKNQKFEMICINEGCNIKDFEKEKNKLKKAFELILPFKSTFENVENL